MLVNADHFTSTVPAQIHSGDDLILNFIIIEQLLKNRIIDSSNFEDTRGIKFVDLATDLQPLEGMLYSDGSTGLTDPEDYYNVFQGLAHKGNTWEYSVMSFPVQIQLTKDDNILRTTLGELMSDEQKKTVDKYKYDLTHTARLDVGGETYAIGSKIDITNQEINIAYKSYDIDYDLGVKEPVSFVYTGKIQYNKKAFLRVAVVENRIKVFAIANTSFDEGDYFSFAGSIKVLLRSKL